MKSVNRIVLVLALTCPIALAADETSNNSIWTSIALLAAALVGSVVYLSKSIFSRDFPPQNTLVKAVESSKETQETTPAESVNSTTSGDKDVLESPPAAAGDNEDEKRRIREEEDKKKEEALKREEANRLKIEEQKRNEEKQKREEEEKRQEEKKRQDLLERERIEEEKRKKEEEEKRKKREEEEKREEEKKKEEERQRQLKVQQEEEQKKRQEEEKKKEEERQRQLKVQQEEEEKKRQEERQRQLKLEEEEKKRQEEEKKKEEKKRQEEEKKKEEEKKRQEEEKKRQEEKKTEGTPTLDLKSSLSDLDLINSLKGLDQFNFESKSEGLPDASELDILKSLEQGGSASPQFDLSGLNFDKKEDSAKNLDFEIPADFSLPEGNDADTFDFSRLPTKGIRGLKSKKLIKDWGKKMEPQFEEEEKEEPIPEPAPSTKNNNRLMDLFRDPSEADVPPTPKKSFDKTHWKVGDDVIKECGLREDMNKKGLRKSKKMSMKVGGTGPQMEDMNLILFPWTNDRTRGLFSVYDGHAGNECARKAIDRFPEIFEEQIEETSVDQTDSLTETFRILDEELATYEYEGCTATSILIWEHGDYRYIQSANVGDSTAFIKRGDNVEALSKDHKPIYPEERQRIIDMGIEFGPHQTRVGGLAVSRALGDHFLKNERLGVISVPYVSPPIQLKEEDTMVILASDGLWDVMSGQEAVEYCCNYDDADTMASELMKKALSHPKVWAVGAQMPREVDRREELKQGFVFYRGGEVTCNTGPSFQNREEGMDSDGYITLRSFLLQKNTRHATEEEVRYIFKRIILTLEGLHGEGKTHGNLNLETIYVNRTGEVKPIQGAKIVYDRLRESQGRFNLPILLQPNHFVTPAPLSSGARIQETTSQPNLIYGAWVLMRYSLTLMLPADMHQVEVFFNITRDVINLPTFLSPECVDVITRALRLSPSLRPNLNELKRHPWLTSSTLQVTAADAPWAQNVHTPNHQPQQQHMNAPPAVTQQNNAFNDTLDKRDHEMMSSPPMIHQNMAALHRTNSSGDNMVQSFIKNYIKVKAEGTESPMSPTGQDIRKVKSEEYTKRSEPPMPQQPSPSQHLQQLQERNEALALQQAMSSPSHAPSELTAAINSTAPELRRLLESVKFANPQNVFNASNQPYTNDAGKLAKKLKNANKKLKLSHSPKSSMSPPQPDRRVRQSPNRTTSSPPTIVSGNNLNVYQPNVHTSTSQQSTSRPSNVQNHHPVQHNMQSFNGSPFMNQAFNEESVQYRNPYPNMNSGEEEMWRNSSVNNGNHPHNVGMYNAPNVGAAFYQAQATGYTSFLESDLTDSDISMFGDTNS
ncbi:hypothetical protein PROFUN_05046 [Planoprotostelium fungivorum]|uniref:PPM-type phosphatase domain-containing protein n=1 Tax=Planoprotostelium fungivorum TaxID=1890364 RepID=A0A2P6NS87_9EUKA|nr:hypothetical protein PROFUN_05046 [Planoprotostelium fungivorum]